MLNLEANHGGAITQLGHLDFLGRLVESTNVRKRIQRVIVFCLKKIMFRVGQMGDWKPVDKEQRWGQNDS